MLSAGTMLRRSWHDCTIVLGLINRRKDLLKDEVYTRYQDYYMIRKQDNTIF